MVRIRIESLRRLNLMAEIGSKNSIKRRFKSDLKRILALGRLNRISLLKRVKEYDLCVKVLAD